MDTPGHYLDYHYVPSKQGETKAREKGQGHYRRLWEDFQSVLEIKGKAQARFVV